MSYRKGIPRRRDGVPFGIANGNCLPHLGHKSLRKNVSHTRARKGSDTNLARPVGSN